MEEDYADIYYVDSRNAVTRDHRPQQGQPRLPWVRPRPTSLPPTRTVYVPPAQTAIPAGYAQPIGYAPQPMIYAGPYPGQSTAATLLGKLTTGQIVEMVAQMFAAVAAGSAGCDARSGDRCRQHGDLPVGSRESRQA